MLKASAVLEWLAILWLSASAGAFAFAQELPTNAEPQPSQELKVTRNDQGLYELVAPRLTLITDIPIDDELKSWPNLIEQSLGQWSAYFGVDPKRMAQWRITATLIGDRERLTALGALEDVPGFDEGYQYGDVIYLREQPTAYYRRHLFLHEATHWIVWKLYGGGGSPWFMEGMAELQGTHSLKNGVLRLGVIPASRDQVAKWGRLRRIDDTLKAGFAPSLSEILAYGNSREDHETRYSWSWAACVFFTNHPKYGPILKELYQQKMDYSNSLSNQFKQKLMPMWSDVQLDWNAFVSDLDFGYNLERSRVDRGGYPPTKKLVIGEMEKRQLDAGRGWQSTGVMVEPGKFYQVACTGSYKLIGQSGTMRASWESESQGITYQYYRGNPLGCVIAAVIPGDAADQTQRWETIPVGAGAILKLETSGELFLKVNEPSNGLYDNEGAIEVAISIKNP